MKMTIELLLPTYNGSRYLPELLDSLCNQTVATFTLLTYDDGSTDDSIAITDRYAGRLDIKRIANTSGVNIGAVKSFELLLNESSADCIMLCDQDDIWENDKIDTGVKNLSETMERCGDMPIALFSDLSLISGNSEDLKMSFLESTGFNPAALTDPYYLAFRNPAPGCAMTINRSLVSTALPFQATAPMHDWWLMQCASITGRIIFIDSKLIRYRIHSSNTLGMAHDQPRHPLRSMITMLCPKNAYAIVNRLEPGIRQAEAVFRNHGKRFSRLRFWMKFVAGRYVFPYLGKAFPPVVKYSWKRPRG